MDDLVKEIIPLLQYLIPGFLSAWVFYSLTAFKRPNTFGQIVQADVYVCDSGRGVGGGQLLSVDWLEGIFCRHLGCPGTKALGFMAIRVRLRAVRDAESTLGQ